ncbi:hypothetical protein CWI84_02890 [Idiomarina tyrosinivorans]|uniref:Uncharacterized protein n=1 Tax=Idiomarina tyrosinivorans TaxID=1445662 RepID=A0A432ZT92_9GAMM|nr:hypothetical protein [Idiomarina tyrosinivorans]RUO81072.1 hypothetical protein CWI84_02890 [Idiomarina tyrosinivorans]
MTTIDEFKKSLLEAAQNSSDEEHPLEDLARRLINVERKCIYGDEPSHTRLKKFRELIAEEVANLKDDENEA